MAEENGPRHGAGDVPITLGGQEFYLKPSAYAAQHLSRAQGGLAEVMFRLQKYDFDLLVTVIAFGLGQSGKGSKDLPDKIYEAGMHDINPLAVRYVGYLMNGGRPPPDDPKPEDGEDEDPSNA